MKHALFVAFHYPPEASSSGVLRTLKYTRYLADFGWRVTVLTLKSDAYEVTDRKLEEQIPQGVRVIRTKYLNTKRHLSILGCYPALLAIPDPWIGWLPWAASAGAHVLAEDPAHVVYSTSPHGTSHVVAMTIARRAGLPFVTDFRDPWYEEPPEPGTPAVVHWAARRLERVVVHRSAHVVTSTAYLRDLLRTRYSGLPSEKFTAIPNGYDEADFAAMPDAPAVQGERFVIVHAGLINGAYRDPRPLCQAIERAGRSGAIDLNRIRLRFIGGGPYADADELRTFVSRHGLQGVVEFLPRVPYESALRELAKADLLLLLQASEDTVGLVPAKLYEYLRTRRPVLALVLPGVTSEVLGATGGGWAINPRDEEALEQAVVEAYGLWERRELSGHLADPDQLRRYDRRVLTGDLAAIFDRVAGDSRALAAAGG